MMIFSKWGFGVGLLVILMTGLAGCDGEITAASPNPDTVIHIKLGERPIFKVEAASTGMIKYGWFRRGSIDSEKLNSMGMEDLNNVSNTYTFDIDPVDVYNKMKITCYMYAFGRVPTPWGGYMLGWGIVDSRTWEIRISQDPPVWHGGYKVEDTADLQALSDFTKISGHLLIRNTSLTGLDELSGLTSVGRILSIGQNSVLVSLEGLHNLTSVGEDMKIYNNTALPDLLGLKNLTSIGGNLGIGSLGGNPSLTSVKGLDNLTSIGRSLGIQNNEALSSLEGLDNITSVYSLIISKNSALTSLDGLENLVSIGDNLQIYDNDSLANLNGLVNLTSIGGHLSIFRNDSLIRLTGLSNLTSVGGPWLMISDNATLESLAGLNNVTSVISLYIRDNEALTSLGLNSLCHVGYFFYYGPFEITSNIALCTDLAEGLRDQVQSCSSIFGDIDISYNKDCSIP